VAQGPSQALRLVRDVDCTEPHHWAHRARISWGPGKTNSPENFTSLMNDLESKIFDRFDDATVVHPGHGDDTTLDTERPHLGTWRKRGW
jgi:glyoxylase-like metal-dependent hydrolase (beta-lactamase superfamily II)